MAPKDSSSKSSTSLPKLPRVYKRKAPCLDLDYNEIIPGLSVGSAPDQGWAVAANGFDVLVLCAREYQPDPKAFPGVEVHYCPLPDYHLDPDIVRTSFTAARRIVDAMRMGRQVLITCLAGHDRSASIAALVLYYLYFNHGWSGRDCVRYVQSKRRDTLRGVQGRWLKTLPAQE